MSRSFTSWSTNMDYKHYGSAAGTETFSKLGVTPSLGGILGIAGQANAYFTIQLPVIRNPIGCVLEQKKFANPNFVNKQNPNVSDCQREKKEKLSLVEHCSKFFEPASQGASNSKCSSSVGNLPEGSGNELDKSKINEITNRKRREISDSDPTDICDKQIENSLMCKNVKTLNITNCQDSKEKASVFACDTFEIRDERNNKNRINCRKHQKSPKKTVQTKKTTKKTLNSSRKNKTSKKWQKETYRMDLRDIDEIGIDISEDMDYLDDDVAPNDGPLINNTNFMSDYTPDLYKSFSSSPIPITTNPLLAPTNGIIKSASISVSPPKAQIGRNRLNSDCGSEESFSIVFDCGSEADDGSFVGNDFCLDNESFRDDESVLSDLTAESDLTESENESDSGLPRNDGRRRRRSSVKSSTKKVRF